MRQRRDQQAVGAKRGGNEKIVAELLELIATIKPKAVHSYLPMGSEVDIWPVIEYLLQAEVTVVTPKSLPKRKLEHLVLKSTNELEEGIFGTRHPAGSQVFDGRYDLIIVPGLAFDHHGNRLGYGAGYYDNFLKDHPEAYKVGVAYPFQVLEKIPVDAHDVRLDEIIS